MSKPTSNKPKKSTELLEALANDEEYVDDGCHYQLNYGIKSFCYAKSETRREK